MASTAHIDLKGASGVRYRFLRVDGPERLPAIAGNFAFVRGGGADAQLVGCGEANDLTLAAVRWPDAAALGAEAIYIRLNVMGSVRQNELEDIAAEHQPALVIQDSRR